jgi:hypothetical protein
MSFSEGVRAQVFIRDRALCGYSGRGVWLGYAHGTDDQCDHIIPVGDGGSDEVTNAITAWWKVNHEQGKQKHLPILFQAGELTAAGRARFTTMPERVAEHLHRMRHLHLSDFYLNRAFANLWHGVHWLTGMRRKDHRTDVLQAKTTLAFLKKWRARGVGISAPEKRGLAPLDNSEIPQVAWGVRRHTSEKEILVSMHAMAALAKDADLDNGGEISGDDVAKVLMNFYGVHLDPKQFRKVDATLKRRHRVALEELAEDFEILIPVDAPMEEPAAVNADHIVDLVGCFALQFGTDIEQVAQLRNKIRRRHSAALRSIAAEVEAAIPHKSEPRQRAVDVLSTSE